jgi:hypothetical protein
MTGVEPSGVLTAYVIEAWPDRYQSIMLMTQLYLMLKCMGRPPVNLGTELRGRCPLKRGYCQEKA